MKLSELPRELMEQKRWLDVDAFYAAAEASDRSGAGSHLVYAAVFDVDAEEAGCCIAFADPIRRQVVCDTIVVAPSMRSGRVSGMVANASFAVCEALAGATGIRRIVASMPTKVADRVAKYLGDDRMHEVERVYAIDLED